MSLALVQVSVTDFNTIYSHIALQKHSNMHLREARQKNKKRVLRYLHAMYAGTGRPEIDGVISGPGVFWHYKLLLTAAGQTRIRVLVQRGTAKDAARIQRTFLQEILARVAFEQTGKVHYPKRLSGQLYLRRNLSGTAASHAKCLSAVAAGELDPAFVAQLQPWNFELLRP